MFIYERSIEWNIVPCTDEERQGDAGSQHQWIKKTNDTRKQLDILQVSSYGELIVILVDNTWEA